MLVIGYIRQCLVIFSFRLSYSRFKFNTTVWDMQSITDFYIGNFGH